jgi:ATP-dependent RNA helicase HelY
MASPRPDRDRLTQHHVFPLDVFQVQALDVLDDGRSVLVAAPTGSGKTVVAEYGIAAALADGRRAFYTAPIKALSNQKYMDLCRVHGTDRVGLLTGDNSINGDAPVVVMTTEVLRNMIYAQSSALDRLALVVLDEVHFLQDTYRGPVWEEVIIHLPSSVRLVCLSATVSNAQEVAQWISTVRGPTTAVVETRRPVELHSRFLVEDRATDLLQMMPVIIDGQPNPAGLRLDAVGSRPVAGKKSRGGTRRRLATPSRLDVVEHLDAERLLPAIYFIFSRHQCDEAARGVLTAGMRFTNLAERERINDIVSERLAGLDASDLAVLGDAQFIAQLEAGIGVHHAGMVPAFKETVERCFAEGLVKVVFATETLAVGINMPARAVVIEKLTKYTGDHHALLTPAEITQLTGRAGRRGIDRQGTAVVLWSPFVSFERVAGLVASRSFRLTSAFRPTYNMAANLVRTCTKSEAHRLLDLSFAQFQADRDVVEVQARLERQEAALAAARAEAVSPYGDLQDFRRRRGLLSDTARRRDRGARVDVEQSLDHLRPGDVVELDHPRHGGRALVLTSAHRSEGVRVTLLTPRRQIVNVTAADLGQPMRTIGHVDLPHPYAPHRPQFQLEASRRLARARLRTSRRSPGSSDESRHPVEDDPDLQHRLSAAQRADRIERELRELRRRSAAQERTVARRFDDVIALLNRWGYVDDWTLTEAGDVLARTFHESDLLLAEVTRRGLLDDLDAAATAALVSVFVYEHRSPDTPPAPWFPSKKVQRRWDDIQALSAQIALDEERSGLTVHRSPDPTFVAVAYAWASGDGFAELVEQEELTGGDFVRTMRQLIDVLGQLSQIAPLHSTRQRCGEAVDLVRRGVVAATDVGGP